MELIIIIILSLVVIVLGVTLVFNNINKNKKIYLIDWAIIVYLSVYGIGFPVVYLSTIQGKNPSVYAQNISHFTPIEVVQYYVFIISLIIFTKFGWHINVAKSLNVSSQYKSLRKQSTYDINNKYIRKHIKFAWIMLIVSIIAYYLYAMAYGGFYGLLSYAISIRSGIIPISNKFSFLEKFGQFSIISTYIFFAVVIDKNIRYNIKKSSISGLIASVLFSLFFIYSRGGRGLLVFFILTLSLTITYYNSKNISIFLKKIFRKLKWLPIAFIIMDRLWNRTVENDFFSLLVSSISYPFAAYIVNLHNGSYRLFKDFFQAPFYFLPSSIWISKLKFTTANLQTTYLISGAYKGENIGGKIVTGTTPNDLLTFAYMQADLLGIIIVGILFGIFLRHFHNKILNIKFIGIKWMLYSYFVVRFVILVIIGGDIAQIIIGNWGFIVYLLVFNVYSKLSIDNTHSYTR